MKIISIGPAYPLRGGIAKFNEALSSALRDTGNELILYSYRYQYPSYIFPGKTQYSLDDPPPDLHIKSEIHSLNFLSWKPSARKIAKEQPDLVIVHYWMPFFAPCLTSILKVLKHRKIKTILLAHNLIPHERQPGTIFVTKGILKQLSGMICLSQSVKEDARFFRPGMPVEVLPHPVYSIYGELVNRKDALKKLNLTEDPKYLLFFGLVRKYKGLDILLHALPLVKFQNWRLIVAGEFYENREYYDEIIDKYNLEGKLTIYDKYIPDHEVGALFSIADLVVQPYRTATQSGVTQISYYFGVPMIVTNVGGLPEIIDHGKTGYVVPPEPHWIAKAIDEFFSKTDQEKMRKAVLEKKKEYSWESFARRMMDFISGID
ncbi:MAG: glycosyltransferase [Bacteroidales bacterium]|nr:glycosyltransferase [Bacteroidales bacterium]